ncbi:hypothetical protein SLA2020_440800 [Shorea laevis]
MQVTSSLEFQAEMESKYDRMSELKAFDESKAGVKGLADAGVAKIPRIFIHDQKHNDSAGSFSSDPKFSIPIIDFEGIDEVAGQRAKIVEEIRDACEKWGFFQAVNHGIEVSLLDEMIDGVRRFHEQDYDVKKEFYTRDETKSVTYNTNFDFYQAQAANWRDTIYCATAPCPPNPEELPEVCRDILIDYSNEVIRLGHTIFELLSEALGLEPNHLKDMDSGFLNVVLQDQIGGLQVLHQNQWVTVTPIPGSLVVNLGDMMQLISNEKFKSVLHRVLAKNVGPRISVAGLFRTHFKQESTPRARWDLGLEYFKL